MNIINLDTSGRRIVVSLLWGPFTIAVTLSFDNIVESTENPVNRLVIAALEVRD